MTPEQIEAIIEKYGKPAFELAMKQVYINVGLSIVFGFGLTIITIVLAFLSYRVWRQYRAFIDSGKPSYDTMKDMTAFGLGLASVLVGIVAVLILSGMTVLLNPEWAALRMLIK